MHLLHDPRPYSVPFDPVVNSAVALSVMLAGWKKLHDMATDFESRYRTQSFGTVFPAPFTYHSKSSRYLAFKLYCDFSVGSESPAAVVLR